MARVLSKYLVERFGKECPTAVRCFEEDFEACVAPLKCPPKHRRFVRTTHLLERLFVEERRHVKAAGMMFGERAVLKLMVCRGVPGFGDMEGNQSQRVRACSARAARQATGRAGAQGESTGYPTRLSPEGSNLQQISDLTHRPSLGGSITNDKCLYRSSLSAAWRVFCGSCLWGRGRAKPIGRKHEGAKLDS